MSHFINLNKPKINLLNVSKQEITFFKAKTKRLNDNKNTTLPFIHGSHPLPLKKIKITENLVVTYWK